MIRIQFYILYFKSESAQKMANNSNQSVFNVKGFKESFSKVEYMFLYLGIIFGLLFVFYNPPWQTNDEDRHFYLAWQISNFQIFAKANEAEQKVGCEIPKNLYNTVNSFQGIPFASKQKITKDMMENAKAVPLNSDDKMFINHFHPGTTPLGFIPAAIGIDFARIFSCGPIWIGWWARIFALASYLIIIFYAIRITPIMKVGFMLYALTPMALFQGASVTYDTFSNASSLLLVAYMLYFAFDKKAELGNREFLFMILLIFLHEFAKHGYLFIAFMFLLIPYERIKITYFNQKVFTGLMFVYAAVVYKLVDLMFSSLVPDFSHIKQPVFQNDFYFSVAENTSYWLARPVELVAILIKNFLNFRHEWIGGVIGRFGYSYTALPIEYYFMHGLVLISVAFMDNRSDIKIAPWQKAILFFIVLFDAGALIFQFLLTSPVGAQMIFGFQGRYLVQLVPVLMLLFYQNKITIPEWDKNKLMIVAIYIIFALIYAVTWMDERFFTL